MSVRQTADYTAAQLSSEHQDQLGLVRDLIMLGDLSIRNGEPKNAIPHFKEILRVDPNNLAANYNAGCALNLLGRAEEARPTLRRRLRFSSKCIVDSATSMAPVV
jgi:Flp pilus assembly protein TadD